MSVVVPTHNRSRLLDDTLARLSESRLGVPWEIVVVANACSDDTAAVADRWATRGLAVRLELEDRPSAAVARNAGARAAVGQLLLFLDDDILVEPQTLDTIAQWSEANPGVTLVGQVLPLPEHLATPFGAFRDSVNGGRQDGAPSDVDWFASGLAAVPSDAFRLIGGYSEAFPAAGLEDADFAIRARRDGYRIVFHPDVVGHHNDWAGTTAQDFCRRAATHVSTAYLLDERFPGVRHPWSELIATNRPARPGDPWGDRATKWMKGLGVLLGADRWLPVAADRLGWPRAVRSHLYRASISLSMFAGYQRGLRIAGHQTGRAWPSGHERSG